jgi:hypothetical protein
MKLTIIESYISVPLLHIRSCVNRVIGLADIRRPYNVQNVAAPDTTAGKVPIAAAEIPVSAEQGLEVLDILRTKLGLGYVPDEVMSIQNLGMEKFPRTVLGKAQKSTIAALVETYSAKRRVLPDQNTVSDLAQKVHKLWAVAAGLPV